MAPQREPKQAASGRVAALSGALRTAAMLNKPGKAGRVLRLSNTALSSSGRTAAAPTPSIGLEKLICFRRPGGNKSTFRPDSLRDYSRESPANPCFRMKSAQLCTRGVRGEPPCNPEGRSSVQDVKCFVFGGGGVGVIVNGGGTCRRVCTVDSEQP